MSAQLGLGRLYNCGVSTTTAKQRFNMENCAVAGILLVGATGATNVTVNECNAATGGTEQALAVVTTYWDYAAQATPTAWVKHTQAAASTVPSVANGVSYFEVAAVSMSDGFKYLDVTHATGTAVFILHELEVKRAPENLKLSIS
jgi:hypothetical protein